MRMTVAVVNNDPSSSQSNLKRYLDQIGCNYHTFDYRNLSATTDIAAFDCFFLTGTGEKTWTVPSPYAEEMSLVKRCTVPILGICGGHQIIAQAYGGELAMLDAPIYGRTRVQTTEEATPLFDGLPPEFVVFSKHQGTVGVVPSGFRIIARAAGHGIPYAIQHPHEAKYGVQFHPERRNDGTTILDNFMRIARRARRRREGRNENESTRPPMPLQ